MVNNLDDSVNLFLELGGQHFRGFSASSEQEVSLLFASLENGGKCYGREKIDLG